MPSDPLVLLRSLGPDAVPLGAEERVHARLTASLAGAIGAGEVGAEHGAGAAHYSSEGASAARVALEAGRAARPFAVWMVPAFVAAAITGAALDRMLAPEKVKTVYVDRIVERPPVPLVTQDPVVKPEERKEPESPASAVAPAPKASAGSELSRERSLLDLARAKMTSGELTQALDLLERHKRVHPRGTLVEEREAMAINALVTLERYVEARQRGASFRERFPKSLVLPSVEAALAAIPEE